MNDFKSRSNKYKKNNKKDNTVVYGLDDTLMTLFCSYVVSSNSTIHKYCLSNLDRLMKSIDESVFNNNQLLLVKYKFLKLALEDKLKGLSGDVIISDISRHLNIEGLEGFTRELNNEEVKYIEETITQYLDSMSFDKRLDSLLNLITNYQQADYRERDIILNNIKLNMVDTLTEFRKNDFNKQSATTRFRLSAMEDTVTEIHKYITNPSNRLITGMQGFNDILGGGFQKTRLYCIFGLAGEGKTITLVNLLYQVWKRNKNVVCKDKTKKPCIILLTMENLVIEYISTLFYVITQGKRLKEQNTAQDCLREFKERKFEYTNPESDIEILIDYKPVNSVDTRYTYQLIEEMEDEGFECIMLFMDYLARIKPSEATKDTYVDLGTIANDFKSLAISKDIPVLTASQLNRQAATIVDQGRNSNYKDTIKNLGRTTIGDSINIDRNIDGSIIIVPEEDQRGNKYMAFKLTKHRYEINTNTKLSIYQPIVSGTKVAFQEDLFGEPLFRETLVGMDQQDMLGHFENVQSVGVNNIRQLIGNQSDNMLKNTYVEEDEMIEINRENLVENNEKNLKVIVDRIPKEEIGRE